MTRQTQKRIMTRQTQKRVASEGQVDTNDDGPALPPPRKPNTAQPLGNGYLWNGMTQELIPILPEDHPSYLENQEIVRAAILRWDGKSPK